MELKQGTTEKRESEQVKRKTPFTAKALLATTLLVGAAPFGCTLKANVNIVPETDAGGDCTAITSCETKTGYLREEGNSAGGNTLKIGDATLRLAGVVDQGSTKAANLEMTACDEVASGTFVAGQESMLTTGNDSFNVKNEAIEYDASGLRVKVSVTPVCPAEDAGAQQDTSAGSDAGADSGE